MSDEKDPKRAILARRAKFIAAAVASIGIACGKEPSPQPTVCLSATVDPDSQPPKPLSNPDAQAPQPCLSQPMPRDAGGSK